MQWKIVLEGTDELGDHHRTEYFIEKDFDRLRNGEVGFTVEDGKKIMSAIQQLLVKQQCAMYAETRRICMDCEEVRPVKDYTARTIRTVFGNVIVENPRFGSCRRCWPYLHHSWAPLSEICPDRATRELLALSARMGSLMPYRKASEVLAEFLPCQSERQFTTLRHRTLAIGKKLGEKADDRYWFDPPSIRDRKQRELPLNGDPLREFVVSIDTAHIPRRKREGGRTLETVIGHCARGGRGSKPGPVFAYADFADGNLRSRTLEALRDQGYEGRGDITVISDGAEFLKRLPKKLPQPAAHIIDWFHLAMKIQPLQQMAEGLVRGPDNLWRDFGGYARQVRSLKWRLWNGQADRAIALANKMNSDLRMLCLKRNLIAVKLRGLLWPLRSYIRQNASSLVDYGARYRNGQRIATTMAESSVNSLVAVRMVKKQQMRWSRRGAHLMLQVRAAVANDDLDEKLAYERPSPEVPSKFRVLFGAEPPLLAAA